MVPSDLVTLFTLITEPDISETTPVSSFPSGNIADIVSPIVCDVGKSVVLSTVIAVVVAVFILPPCLTPALTGSDICIICPGLTNTPASNVSDFSSQAVSRYLNFRKTSIYGGSNEIQKNIIAKAILGV